MGFVWVAVAAVTWWISYWVIYWLFTLPAVMLGSMWNWSPSAAARHGAAVVGCAVLVVEGVRFGKRLFDIESYSRSLYNEAWQVGKRGLPFVSLQLGNPAGAAWIISQFLLVAPRSTVRSVTSFRSIVRLDADAVARAEQAVARLRGRKGWVFATDFGADPEAFAALDRLKVIRSKVENGCVMIRLGLGLRVTGAQSFSAESVVTVEHFLRKHFRPRPGAVRTRPPRLSTEALSVMQGYAWPGNIRELENGIERCMVLGGEFEELPAELISQRVQDAARAALLQASVANPSGAGRDRGVGMVPRGHDKSPSLKDAVEQLERNLIHQGLIRTHWNKSQLAKELGISRSNLIMKVERYGLDKKP